MTHPIPRRTLITGALAVGVAVAAPPTAAMAGGVCVNGTDPGTVSGTATTVASFSDSPNSSCPKVYAELRHMPNKALGWGRVTLQESMPYDDRFGITPTLTMYLRRKSGSSYVNAYKKVIKNPKKGTQYWTLAACTEHFTGVYWVRIEWLNGDGTAGHLETKSVTLVSGACPFTGV